MPQHGVEHVGALVVIAVAAVLLTVLARRSRDPDRVDRIARACGWVLLVVSVVWSLWAFLPMNWDVNQSLPFHFSDAARIFAAIALITRWGWALCVSYFWGLTLNLQSVLTPDLNYLQQPALEYTMYWLLHGAVLVAPIVQTWGQRYRPTWRGYGVAFGVTVLWAAIAFTANLITGANYGYLNRAPAGPSLLDVLGPWPIYLLWEAVLVASVWSLMTWPCATGARRRTSVVEGRMRLVRRGQHARVAIRS